MAIQHRRGRYEDFDPGKLLPGEIAVVLSGDPASSSGRSIYVCFQAGTVKRFTTYEDFQMEMQTATAEIQASFTESIRAATTAATEATRKANTAQDAAVQAAERANKAALDCEGILDNTRMTAAEQKINQIIEMLKNVISTEEDSI